MIETGLELESEVEKLGVTKLALPASAPSYGRVTALEGQKSNLRIIHGAAVRGLPFMYAAFGTESGYSPGLSRVAWGARSAAWAVCRF